MNTDGTRYYEIRSGWGSESKCLCWGLSRFGNGHDAEMEAAVCQSKKPGDGTSFCICFVPVIPKVKSPAVVRAQRIRNMKARAARMPLLADQIEAEEMQKSYYSEAEAERDQADRRALNEKLLVNWWAEHTPDKQIILSAKIQN